MEKTALIILAAGKGTRMQSQRAKVLHEICGVPMIRYVVKTALGVTRDVVVVVGHQEGLVREALADLPGLRFAVQREQLGTGHAVMMALPSVPAGTKDVAILCGDTPLIRIETVVTLIERHCSESGLLTLLATRLKDPFGYGRLICGQGPGRVSAIIEEADAEEAQKAIDMVNTGAYCINLNFLESALPRLKRDNAQGEFYLTDVVAEAGRGGRPALVVEALDSDEVLGVNTKDDLARAERQVRRRLAGKEENPLDF